MKLPFRSHLSFLSFKGSVEKNKSELIRNEKEGIGNKKQEGTKNTSYRHSKIARNLCLRILDMGEMIYKRYNKKALR